MVFRVEPPPLRCERGARCDAPLWFALGGGDQLGQAIQCIFAICLLRAEALRKHDDLTVAGQPTANESVRVARA